MGLYRLRGHTNEVTQLKFLKFDNILISSSKDTFLKAWDLDTQHCFQTIVTHSREIWDFAINYDETNLITGSSDNEMRVFKLSPPKIKANKTKLIPNGDKNGISASDFNIITYIASFQRKGKKRVSQISLSSNGTLLFCLSSGDKKIECYRVRSPKEILKKIKRRKKRKREKLKNRNQENEDISDAEDIDVEHDSLPSDIYVEMLPLRTKHKILSFDLFPKFSPVNTDAPTKERVILSHSDNMISTYHIVFSNEENIFTRDKRIDFEGHRSGIRSVCLNRDDSLLMTTSNDLVKIWNTRTQNCVRTLKSGYGLCSLFAPNDKHVIIGTKEGNIEIYDLKSSLLTQKIHAHSGSI